MVKLFIVDELPLTRLGLYYLISKINYVSVIGQTSNFCKGLLLTEQLSPDILILNKSTPGLKTLEFIQNTLSLNNPPKIIILSAYEDVVWLKKIYDSGVSGYLLKEHGFTDLELAIKTVMSGECYFPAISSDCHNNVKISSRECEVLVLIADGHTSREVGSILNISHRTVEHHRANLMEKLNINDLSGLTKYAVRCGITDPSIR